MPCMSWELNFTFPDQSTAGVHFWRICYSRLSLEQSGFGTRCWNVQRSLLKNSQYTIVDVTFYSRGTQTAARSPRPAARDPQSRPPKLFEYVYENKLLSLNFIGFQHRNRHTKPSKIQLLLLFILPYLLSVVITIISWFISVFVLFFNICGLTFYWFDWNCTYGEGS